MNEPAIWIKGLSFRYRDHLVLDHIDLEVQKGEFIGLIGPNAGGKSTLLKLMLGLLPIQQGQIKLLGRSPEQARQMVGYVPQYPPFRRDFPINVQQVILMGRLRKKHYFYSKQDRALAEQVMQKTEISALAHRPIARLSGGQLQRVLIARALVSEPKLLLLDEPTANIDMHLENELFELFQQLSQSMTLLIVSHDIAFISRYVRRVACLNRRLVCHDTRSIDGRIIEQLYGQALNRIDHA